MPSKDNCSQEIGFNAAIKLLLLSIVLAVLPSCKQSSPIPAEIVGDSMAPLLCGERISQSCPRCGLSFEYGVSKRLKTVDCSNCGKQFLPAGKIIKADQVLVSPGKIPDRWDVVAFEHGDKKTLIKRVLGLPGETIDISGGDVFADGELIQKPAQIVQQTKRQVFDSGFSCPQVLNFLNHDADYWQNQKGALVHQSSDGDAFDWIIYRQQDKSSSHEDPDGEDLSSFELSQIKDHDGFNQSLSRRLNVVEDLIVQTDLNLSAGAKFRMVRVCRGTTYETTLTVDEALRECEVRFSFDDTESSFRMPCVDVFRREVPISVSFSNIDRAIKLVVNEETIVQITESASKIDGQALPERQLPYFKFGLSRRSNGRVNRCRIWRDIFYFAERGAKKFRLPMKLGQDEYFVVGDNVPVSKDSRHFGAVANIIGTVNPRTKDVERDSN